MKKRVFGILILAVILLTSCVKSFSSIKPEEYAKYCKVIEGGNGNTFDNAFNYSPLAYNFIKGNNLFADYTIKIIVIQTPLNIVTLYGDPTALLSSQYPDADLIISYHNYYYICTKKK